jgi:ribonucleoside-diphosphate reductase alpha chain
VEEPFTEKARFNWEKFRKHVGLAQRIMDDIIDLELEKVDAILDKIYKDPEDEEIKRVEINLWKNIKRKAVEGRRTGVGITAEGDMLAGLGLQYGSENAIDFSVEVHKTVALEAYRSSVTWPGKGGPSRYLILPRKRKIPLSTGWGKRIPVCWKR